MFVITVFVLITRNEGKGEHKSNYSSEEELSFFHSLSLYYKDMQRQRQCKISGVAILQDLVVILQKRKKSPEFIVKQAFCYFRLSMNSVGVIPVIFCFSLAEEVPIPKPDG